MTHGTCQVVPALRAKLFLFTRKNGSRDAQMTALEPYAMAPITRLFQRWGRATKSA